MGAKERIMLGAAGALILAVLLLTYARQGKSHPQDSERIYSPYTYSTGTSRTSASRSRPYTVSATSSEPSEMVVHVVGEVKHPGVYTLKMGARAQDAVHAAGGPKPDADIESINLAEKVADGEQIRVPAKGQASPSAPVSSRGGKSGGKSAKLGNQIVSLNSATAEDLQQVPGIGPSTAERILSYRQVHGPFHSVEDLRSVGGIGDKKLEEISPHVRL